MNKRGLKLKRIYKVNKFFTKHTLVYSLIH